VSHGGPRADCEEADREEREPEQDVRQHRHELHREELRCAAWRPRVACAAEDDTDVTSAVAASEGRAPRQKQPRAH
jgi:hypothetical protein